MLGLAISCKQGLTYLNLSQTPLYSFKHADTIPVFRLLSPIVSRTFWFSTLRQNRIECPTMYRAFRMKMHQITETMLREAVPQIARVESMDIVLDQSRVPHGEGSYESFDFSLIPKSVKVPKCGVLW